MTIVGSVDAKDIVKWSINGACNCRLLYFNNLLCYQKSPQYVTF